jgi:metallo-beta-lactamase family protein
MKLEFYGAAGGVTGSHAVLDADNIRIGIDAGLFQGGDSDQNQRGFGHDPRSLKSLLLTHAHIDHSGRVPLLVKEGFSGPVYSTPATEDLCEIMLKDSAYLMQEAADRENRHRDQRSGQSRPPLYTEEDVVDALKRFKPIDYDKVQDIGGISVKFMDAGHIIGSAMIELSIGNRKLIFTGDLGRRGAPFLRDPQTVNEADWLVIESTYGDRDHGDMAERGKRLVEVILGTMERGGNVVIPAFAVGRTQEIIYELNHYAEKGKLKGVKVFVDSPMAISATEIYRRHPEYFDEETLRLLETGDNPLDFPGIKYARSRDESKAINDLKEPHIIISASGMCTGGRVLHHLVQNIGRKDSTILFIGYQAEGTTGRRLLNGAKTIKIMNKELDVRARIESLDTFSAHAGRTGMLNWLRSFKEFPSQVFVNHGEPEASRSFAEAIRGEFDAEVVVPQPGQKYDLM